MDCENCFTILSNKEVEEVIKTRNNICPYCDKCLKKDNI